MKKIFRFAAGLIFATSFFGVPLLALAGTQGPGQICTDSGDCITGLSCNSSGVCASSSNTTNTTNTTGGVNDTYLRFYYDLVLTVVNSYLVPILVAIAFIVFLWGVFNYFVYGADDEAKRKEGRQFVMWGIIGLVIIFSTWALVNIVKSTIIPSGANNNTPAYPKL